MKIEIGNGLNISEIWVWPTHNAENRVKAIISITFNDTLRINGCRIIDGAKALFLSYPSEKKPGTDQWFPAACCVDHIASNAIQDAVLAKYQALMDLAK